ncbi:hypothetical protein J2X21_000788 [Kinneretia asaccharophila]|uniref:DUF4034 domain-containing protein n=1 Tax=Roseateles asaccharophilus TaxID=582607 RepID=A0ABU2A3A4_9BURK|nr:hypothetical protein [Roseateles asaccharophilus]
MSSRWGVCVIALVLLLLLLAAAWWGSGERVARRDAVVAGVDAGVASAPLGDAVVARGSSVPASSASAPAVSMGRGSTESSDAQARAALVQRMKADWCGFGAAEQHRQAAAIMESASGGIAGREVIAELNRTPGAQLMAEAVVQVRQRWATTLQQRGDPRSLAVAARLGGADGDEAAARARLQALAHTSSDPMVTALALQWPCKSAGCRNIDAAQWSRLEPANLQAWLALLNDAPSRRTQDAYVLERVASEARYSRSYAREFAALLFSLPQAEAPGLLYDAEMQLIGVAMGAWPLGPSAPLIRMCRAGIADAALLQRCEAVAELMWQADSMLERGLALSLARDAVTLRPALKARWEPRARELEAVRHWNSSVWELKQAPARETMGPCDLSAEFRQHLQANVAQGEWERWRTEMRADGADEAALSAEWRRQAGRGLLDPLPAPQPASGAR